MTSDTLAAPAATETPDAPVAQIAPAAPAMPGWMNAISRDVSWAYPKSIALFGRPGTRKTSLAGELVKRPNKPSVFMLNADNGTESFVNDDETSAAVISGQLAILSIDKFDPYAFLKMDEVINDLIARPLGFEFAILDSLNVMQEIARDYFLANTFAANGKRDTQAAWGEIGKWTDKVARGLHNAAHITPVFILHEVTNTEETGSVSVIPKLQGSMKETFASIPSIVAHVGFEAEKGEDGSPTGKTELIASLGESEVYPTKNRYSRFLQSEMRDFSLLSLYGQLDEHLSGAQTITHPNQAAA